jgi:hypothetical protein
MMEMNDLSDTAPSKRRRASRKGAKPVDAPTDAPAEAAVRAILDHALQPDAEGRAEAEVESALADASSAAGPRVGGKTAGDPPPAESRRALRKRGKSAKRQAAARAQYEPAAEPADAPDESATAVEAAPDLVAIASVEVVEAPETGDRKASAHNEVELVQAGFTETGASAVQSMGSGPIEVDRYETDPYDAGPNEAGPDGSDPHESDPQESEPPAPERHDPDRYHYQHYHRPEDDLPYSDGAPPGGHEDPPPPAPLPPPSHHHWVYLGLGVFLLALGFGVWGVWAVFFSGGDPSGQSVAALTARSEKLSQEVSTLRRSDQISRDANRDLERTLAERDEEIAGLRADIAFYESFVGATGQRRGLSVHDLDMQLQSGDAWHFVATLTQNLNRGAVNTGRVTLSIEGTRNDRLEKLSWSGLRKQGNAPGVPYSFKYFQQVEGEVMLPKGFKPLRVGVRLVPAGGAAVEQSFPWPETVRSDEGG